MKHQELRLAVAQLRRVHERRPSIVNTRNPDWKRGYLAIRREFMAALAATRAAMATLPGDDKAEQLHAELGRMAHTLALHQASWPVVAIDLDDPAYRLSMQEVDRSVGIFLASSNVILRRDAGHQIPEGNF